MRKSEVMKGSVELAVLTMLSKKKMYGYQITQDLKASKDNVLYIAEGTLYLMLKRLEKHKFIKGQWEKGKGKRKVHTYTITAEGKKDLKARQEHWKTLQKALNKVLLGSG